MLLKNRSFIKRAFILLTLFACVIKPLFAQITDQSVKDLTPREIKGFREEAKKSITDLGNYIQIIANKDGAVEKKNDALALALELFISDNATIEVSSLPSKSKQVFTIRKYLNRIKLYSYSSVKVVWYDVYVGSRFVKGANGYYYGTATFVQKFEGEGNHEQGSYRDVTTKRITIILKKLDVYEGDKLKEKYVLTLGDISVEDTSNG